MATTVICLYFHFHTQVLIYYLPFFVYFIIYHKWISFQFKVLNFNYVLQLIQLLKAICRFYES